MSPTARVLGWVLAVLLLAAAADAGEPCVIVLSWDGLRHDYPDRGRLPALARMQREGARADALVPPFPSNTFPAHATLATGTHPDRHGILGNRFLDPERGEFDYEADASWIEAEPLWVAAERQGVPAAVFFWTGSETDWRGVGARYRRAPFDSGIGEAEKVEQLLAWLDLPAAERPRLLMSWWHGADRAGHAHGPDSKAVDDSLRQQDAMLGRLLAGIDARGLWPDTTLLVVGDHGMQAVGPALDVEGALHAAKLRARVFASGGMAHVYLEDPDDAAAAQRVLAALPQVRAWQRSELPEVLRARHRRAGDVVLLTRPPAQFSSRRSRWIRLEPHGTHGFDPQLAEMGAALLVLGRGAPAGTRLPRIHAVDIAPTVAALLGIDPPARSEGVARLSGTPAQP